MWKEKLEHDGVVFPSPWKKTGIPLKCGRTLIPLNEEGDEIAVRWSKLVEKERPSQGTLRRFSSDFNSIIGRNVDVGTCDFSKFSRLFEKSSKKKSVNVANVDGRLEPTGNPSVGSLTIDRTRRLSGRIHRRLRHEDITLNLSKGARIPPGRWKEIVHDRNANWLAKWKDPISQKTKYVSLAKSSTKSIGRTRDKFDVVERVSRDFDRFVSENSRELSTGLESLESLERREILTCACLIANLGIRIGSTSGAKRGIYGCSTLLKSHLNLEKGRISLNFVGKDAIPYRLEGWSAPRYLYSNLTRLKNENSLKNSPSRQLFPHIRPSQVNSYLTSFHPEMTAKVIRTLLANRVFKRSLESSGNPKKVYRESLEKVAMFCNHLKSSRDLHDKLAINTALSHYLDPRLTTSFAKKFKISVGDLVPKHLLYHFSR